VDELQIHFREVSLAPQPHHPDSNEMPSIEWSAPAFNPM